MGPATARHVSDGAGDTASESSFAHVEEESDTHNCAVVVVKTLMIGDDEVLLDVAWVTKEGRIAHMQHP